jgi:uncharacterized protein YggE
MLERQEKAEYSKETLTRLSRKIFYSAVLIVAVVAFTAGCSAGAAPVVQASSSQPAVSAGGGPSGGTQLVAYQAGGSVVRGITVVGVGTASGTPDVAHVNVGVETESASVQQAVADNKAKMAQLLDALKALGIADKDIQTTNYGVYTQRQPVTGLDGKGGEGPTTYHVNNQVNVTVRDVAKLGDVLDKTVAAGANNIYGVNFSVDDTSKLEADARAKAIADAKARAENLAKLTGVTLGDVLSVSEVIGGASPIFEGARASVAMGLGGGGAPIQPGELEVNMNVQVTYAIK